MDTRVTRMDYTGRFDSSRRTPQGGLKVPAYMTRVGVLQYRQPDGSLVRELRHPDEVFKADSLATLAGAPVTIGHPGKVAPGNWGKHAVGHVGDEVLKSDEKFVSGTLRIQDAKGVSGVEKGELLELSCGYDCDVVREAGEYNGEKYDARQTNITYNHVALLPKNGGRAGNDVRLRLDGVDGETEETEEQETEEGCADPDCAMCKEHKEDCWEGQDEESCHPTKGGTSSSGGSARSSGPDGGGRDNVGGGVKGRSGKKMAYVTVHRTSEGKDVVTEHASKKAAHAHGMELRRQGAQVSAHSKDTYEKLIKSQVRDAKDPEVEDTGDVGGKLPETHMDEATKKAHQDALDSLQKTLDTVTGERDALQKEVAELRDPARMDQAAEDLSTFRADAKSILGADADVKGTRRDVMIAALTKCDSAFKADGLSDEYLRGAFAAEVKRTKHAAQSVATARQTADAAQTVVAEVSPVQEAQKRNDERSRTAWKKKG